ncbi:MAG: hypothetical protein U0175_06655 [Caldilineaceae bacterium]
MRWIDIGGIDLGIWKGEEGIYVFSQRLPIYQRFSAIDPGSRGRIVRLPTNNKKGRAIFVSPLLKDYRELIETLPKLRWQAMHRRHHLEKVRHCT